jgi:hypothetical protein
MDGVIDSGIFVDLGPLGVIRPLNFQRILGDVQKGRSTAKREEAKSARVYRIEF